MTTLSDTPRTDADARDIFDATLRPCPMCGGEACWSKGSGEYEDGIFIKCARCELSSKIIWAEKDDPRDILKEDWNERTSRNVIEQLERELASAKQQLASKNTAPAWCEDERTKLLKQQLASANALLAQSASICKDLQEIVEKKNKQIEAMRCHMNCGHYKTYLMKESECKGCKNYSKWESK